MDGGFAEGDHKRLIGGDRTGSGEDVVLLAIYAGVKHADFYIGTGSGVGDETQCGGLELSIRLCGAWDVATV